MIVSDGVFKVSQITKNVIITTTYFVKRVAQLQHSVPKDAVVTVRILC